MPYHKFYYCSYVCKKFCALLSFFIVLLCFYIALITTSHAQNHNAKTPYKGLLVSSQALYLLAKSATLGIETPKKIFSGKDIGHHNHITPSSIRKIKEADFIVWLGAEIEAPLARILKNNHQSWSVMQVEKLKLLPMRKLHSSGMKSHHGVYDPHLWLDPLKANAIVHGISAARALQYPQHAQQYKKNAQAFTQLTMKLIKANQKHINKINYIAYHDAYQYAENLLPMHYIGAFTTEPEDPIQPRQLMHLHQQVNKLKKSQTNFCLIVNNKRALQKVPNSFQQHVAYIDEKMNEFDDYIQAMKHINQQLSNCY